MSSRTTIQRARRALLIAVPALAVAAGPAAATPVVSGGSTVGTVGGKIHVYTCGGTINGDVGDTYTVTATQVVNGGGRSVASGKQTFKCGADGEWHQQ